MTQPLLLLLAAAATADGLRAGLAAPAAAGLVVRPTSREPRAARAPAPTMADGEYSTKVKMTAETRAPLRQARLFFLYPATIAGASIGGYVALTRLIAGLSGMRTDVTPSSDGLNLAVDLGVVALAVFLFLKDREGQQELLAEVARELGGGDDDDDAAAGGEDE